MDIPFFRPATPSPARAVHIGHSGLGSVSRVALLRDDRIERFRDTLMKSRGEGHVAPQVTLQVGDHRARAFHIGHRGLGSVSRVALLARFCTLIRRAPRSGPFAGDTGRIVGRRWDSNQPKPVPVVN